MNLQTKIPISQQSKHPIDYESEILLLGSCFVENIGEKLGYFKFKSIQNPFGILFHPMAIEGLISKAINNYLYTEDDVFFQNEQWHCFHAHSKLSNVSKDDLLQTLNLKSKLTKAALGQSTHVIITLGTAWVYKFLDTNSIVANCHKVSQTQFKKELLSVETITETLQRIINLITGINPTVQILFTVSPVRHLKDGFVENTRSKAHLIAAIHEVVGVCSSKEAPNLHYFPSYEIMMDELRDYRFYAEDMIHPSSTAIQYIWEQFKRSWISKEVFDTLKEVESIQKSMAHKPFNPSSKAHQSFLKALEVRKSNLTKQFPKIEF